MKKKLFSIFAAAFILLQSTSVFAADSKLIFTELKYYTARIFVCDTQNNKAVLVNVVPVGGSFNINYTRDIEYNAVPLSIGNIYGSKGQKLALSTVNGYLLDSPVKVLIGKNGYGKRILSMDFLK